MADETQFGKYNPDAGRTGANPDYTANENGYVGTDPVYQNYADETHKPDGVGAPLATNVEPGVKSAGQDLHGYEDSYDEEVVKQREEAVKESKASASKSAPAKKQAAPSKPKESENQ